MRVTLEESWGTLCYDTVKHRFSYSLRGACNELPYVSQPVVLNCDLTLNCNMKCIHCVARDMARYEAADLDVSPQLMESINACSFLLVVITGGEPFLPQYEKPLTHLIAGIRRKGIIVDTNGTLMPSDKLLGLLKRRNVLVRVSLDSLRMQDETCLRRAPGRKIASQRAFQEKIGLIPRLRRQGVKLAVQSVLHKQNRDSILRLPEKLKQWCITDWFIQRLIPTAGGGTDKAMMSNREYEEALDAVETACVRHGVSCFTKRDRRHNCVFLMVGKGNIYTQADTDGKKVCLGHISQIANYFEFVSASEHSCRYYAYTASRTKACAAEKRA